MPALTSNGVVTPTTAPTKTTSTQPDKKKPTVIGIYGIPGSGKTTHLNFLKEELGENGDFLFFEGSHMIASLLPNGGLETFHTLSEEERNVWRAKAIETIRDEASTSNKTAIVTGHLMFWPEGDESPQTVGTSADWGVFTHILYLCPPIDVVVKWREADSRSRPAVSAEHLGNWQIAEMDQLRAICGKKDIYFMSLLKECGYSPMRTAELVRVFDRDARETNWSRVHRRLQELLDKNSGHSELVRTAIILDGDKTLAPQDTGDMFWKKFYPWVSKYNPLRNLFGGPLGYSERAFCEVPLLYEELVPGDRFDEICEQVADEVRVYEQLETFLSAFVGSESVFILVVTCGLAAVWERVISNLGLSDIVGVIGGGSPSDPSGFVVTPQIKANIVTRLMNINQMYVLAFGDSPLDLPMLKEADEAFVVVGEEKKRSHSMESALLQQIAEGGLKARQILLPENVFSRLTTKNLPRVRFSDDALSPRSILKRTPAESKVPSLGFLHATNKAGAMILTTPTRDSRISGPALREAHEMIGWYLSIEYLTSIIGLGKYDIPHVQGYNTTGHTIREENQTLIVALMRGGEPMALGVNKAFPRAGFLHATSPTDVTTEKLRHCRTVILVDSVINSGKSIVEFIDKIQELDTSLRIVVVAGVVQADAIATMESPLARRMKEAEAEAGQQIHLVALRLSENKYTGTRGTDTGNRLFNTTHLV